MWGGAWNLGFGAREMEHLSLDSLLSFTTTSLLK